MILHNIDDITNITPYFFLNSNLQFDAHTPRNTSHLIIIATDAA